MLFPSFFILPQAYSSINKRMVIISTQSHKKNISFLYISLFQELASGNWNQPSIVWPKMGMVLLQPRQEAGTLVGQVGGCDEETEVCGHFMGWNLGEGAARHILAFEIWVYLCRGSRKFCKWSTVA